VKATVAVVGGGIAGLAAAFEVASLGHDVLLLERAGRAGGVLLTAPFAGKPLDLGPDAFLARRPEATAFARELGLGADLTSPRASSAFLWVGGRLRRLPEGLVLGLPGDLVSLARSRVLSPRGLARAAADLALPGEPRRSTDPDTAVGPLVRARLGDEVHERLVDPLLGGINAGDSDLLSLRTGVPQLAAAIEGQRSLLLGARKARRKAPKTTSDQPVFHSVRGGLGKLAERALRGVIERGGQVTLGFSADRLEPRPGGRWSVVGSSGARFAADAVVLAVPAAIAAGLVEPHAAEGAHLLRSVSTASVAMVCLAYRSDDVGHALDGSGFLVPRTEGRLMTACSFASSKWVDVGTPGTVVVRVSAGRAGDARAMALDDDELVRRIHGELTSALDVRGTPTSQKVVRWPDAFPQYAPGHAELVASMRTAMPAGVELAGSTYEGVGIPACIGSGRSAARRAVARAVEIAATPR
jgi:oxygen-dependent protoporphyrinogen oxidase